MSQSVVAICLVVALMLKAATSTVFWERNQGLPHSKALPPTVSEGPGVRQEGQGRQSGHGHLMRTAGMAMEGDLRRREFGDGVTYEL